MKFQFQIFNDFFVNDFFQRDFFDVFVRNEKIHDELIENCFRSRFRKKTHDERSEIDFEKVEKFFERNRKERVNLICKRVYFSNCNENDRAIFEKNCRTNRF